jgi:crotonobetainyl-CoA:carnitine CoA-transferase CaiB-like acyl-CoA transferase
MFQLTLNAGKRTLDLNINNEEDLARLRELLEDADVFIQGYRPRVLDRRGLSLKSALEMAARRKKGIVYVEENCYGKDGPYAERVGWQQIADAASGASYIMGQYMGFEEGKSVLPPLPISDLSAGLNGALGAMLALRDRAVKGGSYHVVTSLVWGIASSLEPEIGLYPKDALKKVDEKFKWRPANPEEFAIEGWVNIADGWKTVFPEYIAQDSPFLTRFDNTPWGRMDILKPVARLGDDEATPRWTSGPMPNCYYSRNLKWL